MDEKYTKRPGNLFDASLYGSIDWMEYEREKHIQEPISCHDKNRAYHLNIPIPAEWAEYINVMAKKLKIQPEFLYRKAIQAFFGLPPGVFNDDGYLVQWREVYDLDGEQALREHMQEEDDSLTAKVIRLRDKQLKQGRKR